MKNKKETGQFYTINNPFNHKEFVKWYNKAIKDTDIILEPFAGDNNIPKLIQQTHLKQKWTLHNDKMINIKRGSHTC